MNVPKKVNYSLRKQDLFIQLYANVIPKWDELLVINTLGGNSSRNNISNGDDLTLGFVGWGGTGGGEGRLGPLFLPLSNIMQPRTEGDSNMCTHAEKTT